MFNKLKKHLFFTVICLLTLLYFLFLSLIFFAPKVDTLDRGFTVCTKSLIDEIYTCQNKQYLCVIKAILKNNICDFKVVKDGLILWIEGKQERPWSNYFFEPSIMQAEISNDQVADGYDLDSLSTLKEMETLNKKRIELEKNLYQIKNELPTLKEDKKDEK